MMPRAFTDNATINGVCTGAVRVFDNPTIDTTVWLHAEPDTQLIIKGHTVITGAVTITVTHGQAQLLNATIHNNDDYELIQPTNDPHMWTAHDTANGWVVHAGCVRNLPLSQPWDASTAPDTPTPELTATRQQTFNELAARHT